MRMNLFIAAIFTGFFGFVATAQGDESECLAVKAKLHQSGLKYVYNVVGRNLVDGKDIVVDTVTAHVKFDNVGACSLGQSSLVDWKLPLSQTALLRVEGNGRSMPIYFKYKPKLTREKDSLKFSALDSGFLFFESIAAMMADLGYDAFEAMEGQGTQIFPRRVVIPHSTPDSVLIGLGYDHSSGKVYQVFIETVRIEIK